MATIKVDGIPPFDGEYPFDAATFNGRELHTIKEISQVRAGELSEALAAGDYDLVVAFTVIVLRRAGMTVHPDQILDAEIGAITVDLDDEEAVERPPVSPSLSGNESELGDDEEQNGSSLRSGSALKDVSEERPSDQSLIGQRG